MKNLLSSFLLLFCITTNAQTLTISASGDTGTSGSNWFVAGTNPVTITATGTASINTSVIEGYLNTGTSVTLQSSQDLVLASSIVVGMLPNDVSLTLKANKDVLINSNVSIDATQNNNINKLDIVLHSDSDGTEFSSSCSCSSSAGAIQVNDGGALKSNGGNIILGGGLDITVGSSWATGVSTDYTGINLINTTINSNGGAITLRARGNHAAGKSLGVMLNAGTNINSGSGKINIFGRSESFIGDNSGQFKNGIRFNGTSANPITITSSNTSSDAITLSGQEGYWTGNISTSGGSGSYREGLSFIYTNIIASGGVTFAADKQVYNNTTLSTTGTNDALNITSFENNSFWDSFTWNGTLSGANFVGSSSIAGLTINDIENLSGLTIGKSVNTVNLTHQSAITIAGPITMFGGVITLNDNLTATGDIIISGTANLITDNASRQTITSNNGDIYILMDSDANGSGVLDLDRLTLNAGSGDIVIRGETFNWGTNTLGIIPIFNGTGSFTIESSDDSFGQGLDVGAWIRLNAGNSKFSSITIGKPTNTEEVNFTSSTIGTASFNVAGPITVYGSNIEVNADLNTSSVTNGNINIIAQNNIFGTDSNITTNTAPVLLSANSNANDAGRISLSNVDITTNSGNITLGGGTDGSGYAVGTSSSGSGIYRGIYLNNCSINANGTSSAGNILVRGKGYASAVSDYNLGVDIVINTEIKTNYNGAVSIYGIGGPHSDSSNHGAGINFFSQNSIHTTNGPILIDGTAGGGTTSGADAGIDFDGGLSNTDFSAKIYSTSGDITLTGRRSNLSNSYGILTNVNLPTFIGTDGTNSTSGDVILNADNLNLQYTTNIATTGELTVQSIANSFVDTVTFPSANVSLSNAINSLTIGKTTNTSDISIAGAINIAGPIAVFAGAIEVEKNITATGGNILLDADTGTALNTGKSGLEINAGVAIKTVTSGDITLLGRSGNGNNSGLIGVRSIGTTSSINSAGTLSITGISESASSSVTRGIYLKGAITAVGDITFNGTANATNNYDVSLQDLDIVSTAGNINLYANNVDGEITFAGSNTMTSGNNKNISLFANIYRNGIVTFDTNGGDLSFLAKLGSTSFTEAFSNDDFTFNSNIANVTIGNTANTQSITIDDEMAVSGDIKVYGSDINVNENLSSSASNKAVLLKATNNIITATNKDITTNGGNITFWSDSDADNSGYIKVGDQSDLNSSGGNITLSGGSDLSTGYANGSASTHGVEIGEDNANTNNIHSSGGDISIRGFAQLDNNTSTYLNGVMLASGVNIDSETGAIAVFAKSTDQYGFNISNGTSAGVTITSAKTTGTAIELDGWSSVSLGLVFNYNVNKQVLATAGGDILLRGKTTASSHGIFLSDIDILASSGKITLDAGLKGFTVGGSNPYAIVGSKTGDSNISSSTSDIEVIGDVLNFTPTTKFNTTGTLTLKPSGNSFANTFETNNVHLSNNLTGLTIGKSTNIADIVFNNDTSISGPIKIYGNDIAINNKLEATNSTITLDGSGDVTDGTNGYIVADNLALLDGDVTLDNANNNIEIIAATAIDALSFVNSDALEIGTVGSTNGISANDAIDIATLTGNLTLSKNIITLDQSTNAIILNANKSAAIGTSSGGDIIVNGSPSLSTGANGIIKLFSGTPSNSTGLTALAGGLANERSPYDETSTNFGTALTNGNTYAIYRFEEGTGNLTVVATGGDAINTTWSFNNNKIKTIGSPAKINASVVEGYLATGNLTIEAGNITVDANVNSNTANDLTFKAKNNIITSNTKDITTNGGDIIFWSNSENITTGQANNDISFEAGSNVLTSNGGAIILAGGLDDGSNGGSQGDGIPDGYAYISQLSNSAVHLSGSEILSNGGNVIIRGQSETTGIGVLGSGFKIDSGNGTIEIDAKNTSNDAIYFDNDQIALTSSSTNANAISIKGVTGSNSKHGVVLSNNSQTLIQATGDNGGISIEGISGDDIGLVGSFSGLLQILAKSGPINLKAKNLAGATGASDADFKHGGTNFYLGSAGQSTAINGVTPFAGTSSSNITLNADYLSWGAAEPTIETTGTFTVASVADSFSTLQNLESDWFFIYPSVSGVTFGKETNVQNVTINEDLIVKGFVNAYGKNITVSGNINTSSVTQGDILLKASGNITTLSSKDITTNGGNITLWSNSDENGGYIYIQDGVILDSRTNSDRSAGNVNTATTGGAITLGGGAGTSIPTGYALQNSTSTTLAGIMLGTNTGAGHDSNIAIYSGGGNISLKGKATNSSNNSEMSGIYSHAGMKLDSGVSGNILFDGSAGNNAITSVKGISLHGLESDNLYLRSNNGDITLNGLASGHPGAAYGVFLEGHGAGASENFIEATGTGNVSIIGSAAGGQSTSRDFHIRALSVLAKSGEITISGTSSDQYKRGRIEWARIGSNTYTEANGDANLVTSSSSNISILHDYFDFAGTVSIKTSGTLTLAPSNDDFESAFTIPSNLSIENSVTGLTIGKQTNTSDITFGSNTTIAGPISAYGGNINVNSNLNTSSVSGGDILLKASDNITLNASKSITTDGGALTLWSNSDSNGGHIYIQDNVNIDTRTASDRTANNGSIDDENGGAITLGGGAGTSIPTGYALNNSNSFRGGINLGTESGGASRHNSGISFISGGGDISLKGQQSSTMNGDAAGINAYEGFVLDGGKTGSISLVGDVSGSSASYSDGMNLGNFATTAGGTASYIKTVNGNISLTGTSGSGYTQSRGVLLAGGGAGIFVQSIGTGDITITGTPGGGAGTPYNILLIGANILANSGSIELIGGSTGTIYSSSFVSTIGYKSVSDITSSSSDITVTADKFDLTSGIGFNTSGTLNIRPTVGNSFINTLSTSQLSYSSDVSGLTIGHADNTANITFGSNSTIAGPITAYGGIVTLNANLTTTNNGDISLYTDNALGGLSTARTLTAEGAFKYIPRGTAFTADVFYPITNLIATSTGLTIGKPTNDKNITINADVTGAAGIELYGADVNINSNLKTINSGNMVLKGNTTIAAGKYIESNGNFTHDGDITFKSNATGTAAFGTLGGTFTTTSGVAKTERFIPAKRAFRFLSPSVTSTSTIKENWQENAGSTAGLGTHITGNGGSTNGFDATSTNNPSLFTHDNATTQWAAVANTDVNTLTAGTPYRLMVRGDRTTDLTTNTPTASVTTLRSAGALKTGDFSPVLNPAADGYSFIGNPYQAPVNIKQVLAAATDVNATVVYYWDPTINVRGGWVARNLSANTNDVSSSFNEFIQPNQAVFVKNTSSVTAPALTFTEANKAMTSGAAGVFRTNNNTASFRVKLITEIDNEPQEIDGALVLFNEDYSWEVTDQDINKMGNLDEQVSFKIENQNIAIASQNNPVENAVLPISFTKNRQANYQWQFALENYNGLTPYLFDAQNESYTEIVNGISVAFTTEDQTAEEIDSRFSVVFAPSTLSTNTFAQSIALYPNPAKANQTSFTLSGVDTNSEITLFNTLGQQIGTTSTVSNNSVIVKATTQLQTGVYIVNIKSQGQQTSVKWIVE